MYCFFSEGHACAEPKEHRGLIGEFVVFSGFFFAGSSGKVLRNWMTITQNLLKIEKLRIFQENVSFSENFAHVINEWSLAKLK